MCRRRPSLVNSKGRGTGTWRLPRDGIFKERGERREDRAPGRETSGGEGPAVMREHGPLPGTKRRKDEAHMICLHRGSLLSLSILIFKMEATLITLSHRASLDLRGENTTGKMLLGRCSFWILPRVCRKASA